MLGDILLLENEVLCFACRKSMWRVDPQEDSEDFVAALARIRLQEIQAVTTCQSLWRMLRVRVKFKRWLIDKRYREFLSRCATTIQCVYRGRLGRRRYLTIHRLHRIDNATCQVLAVALSHKDNFWYAGIQLELLMSDYLLLIQQTSGYPSRINVERNIFNVWIIINEVEVSNVIVLQKYVRGALQRRSTQKLRAQLECQRLIESHAVTVLSSIFRSYLLRCKLYEEEKSRDKLNLLAEYRLARKNKLQRLRNEKHRSRIKLFYTSNINMSSSDHYLRVYAKNTRPNSNSLITKCLTYAVNEYINENQNENRDR